MKLNKTYIDNAVYAKEQGKPDYRWDDSLTGFGLRVYPSGKKSFVITYRVNGRKRFMILGAYGPLTLDQARKIAQKKLSEVIDGHDPKETKAESLRGENMAELCAMYLERHAKSHKKTWKEDERRIEKYIIPTMGTRKIKSITRNDIASLHHEIGKKVPYEANRILALLSTLFGMAERWNLVPDLFPNPARKIKKFREEKRDRWVHEDEFPRLAAAINAVENLYIRSALWLYLLTGMRKKELLSLKWEDVDFQLNQVRLGDTKSGRPLYLPLSDAAQDILKNITRKEGNPYVFPGARKGRPLVNIEKPWQRVRLEAELEDVRLHDLRRTVGSWLAIQGNSLYLIGKILNHSNPTTTAVYAHLNQDSMKKALQTHGELIMRLSNEQKDIAE